MLTHIRTPVLSPLAGIFSLTLFLIICELLREGRGPRDASNGVNRCKSIKKRNGKRTFYWTGYAEPFVHSHSSTKSSFSPAQIHAKSHLPTSRESATWMARRAVFGRVLCQLRTWRSKSLQHRRQTGWTCDPKASNVAFATGMKCNCFSLMRCA